MSIRNLRGTAKLDLNVFCVAERMGVQNGALDV
jgi:hypothetical protein